MRRKTPGRPNFSKEVGIMMTAKMQEEAAAVLLAALPAVRHQAVRHRAVRHRAVRHQAVRHQAVHPADLGMVAVLERAE